MAQIVSNSRLSGLGLSPGDPCYDQDHPWYMPNFFNDAAECRCMAANYGDGPGQYTCGQQCVGYGPDSCSVGSVMAAEAGGAAGTLLGTAAASTAATSGIGGTALLIALALGAVVLLPELLRR